MFRALETGRLKAIWIAGTNPVVSLPDLHHVQRALGRAELVVVQDAFHPTETTRFADVLLPAASWGEREWTSTNSERTVSYSEKLVEPPGAALPDWQILCKFAQRLGLSGFDFTSAGQVWDEWIELSRGRLCDMGGMPFDRLKQMRHLQWPCPAADHPGTARLYEDHVFPHPDGKAVLLFRPHQGPKEPTDHEFPITLTTGRIYSHWHTMTRTAKAKQLWRRDNQPFVQVHPALAERLEIAEGDRVQITSRRGTLHVKAVITDRVPEDAVFMPMHWGDLFAAEGAVNYLTISAIGRIAKQPELKHCAVALEKSIAPAAEPAGHSASAHAVDSDNGQLVRAARILLPIRIQP
jgi:ferredoxin-nitrate reductase